MDPIFFTPNQIPIGAEVYACASGSDSPQTDKDGNLLPPLTCLFGGAPLRRRLHPLDLLKRCDGRVILNQYFEVDHWGEGVRFMPREVFSAESAPVRREFAVYVNGAPLMYEYYPDVFVYVAKTTDGIIVSCNGYAQRHFFTEYTLPDSAVLVPTDTINFDKDFDHLGCVGIPKPCVDDWAALEARGVIFHDYAPYKPSKYQDYIGVLLPPGWRVKDKVPWLKTTLTFDILDDEGLPVAQVKQKQSYDTNAWIGTLSLE
jgi:hypothetical protein